MHCGLRWPPTNENHTTTNQKHPARQRRWRRGVATGKGSAGEAQIDRLGAIELVSTSNYDIKLMCLLKKNLSPPDHRVNKKPHNLPSDNLLQRRNLEGIGWLVMAMLLGPANGSIMVRYVLDVRKGALLSNHTIPMLSLFPCLSSNIVKIKCYVCCKWFKHDDCTFFPVVIFFWWFEKHSRPDNCTFFSGRNFFEL